MSGGLGAVSEEYGNGHCSYRRSYKMGLQNRGNGVTKCGFGSPLRMWKHPETENKAPDSGRMEAGNCPAGWGLREI